MSKLISKTLKSILNKKIRIFLWFLLIHGNKKNQLKKIKFLNYTIQVPDPQSFVWQFKEIFIDLNYYFESEDKSPLIIDCGSNIGMSCLYFHSIYPQSTIIAFEADPQICEILALNLRLNGVNNVSVNNAAVWTEDGSINFGVTGNDAGSVLQSEKTVEVKSQRLKNILEKHKLIHFLKIDIEGAETFVLEDCRKKSCSYSKFIYRISFL